MQGVNSVCAATRGGSKGDGVSDRPAWERALLMGGGRGPGDLVWRDGERGWIRFGPT